MKKLFYVMSFVFIISCGEEPERCEAFKFGEFYVFFGGSNASYYKINRTNDELIELDTRGNKVFYTVEWLSKCSYVLKHNPEKNELTEVMKMVNEDGGFIVVLENTPTRENCINYTLYIKGYEESSTRKGMFCRVDD